MAKYTTEQYTSLLAAISEGALRVRYGDKEVEYRSLTEMRQIQKEMEDDLGLSKGKGRRYTTSFNKGLQ